MHRQNEASSARSQAPTSHIRSRWHKADANGRGAGRGVALAAALACAHGALGQPTITSVGVLPGWEISRAAGVSGDGSVVVGFVGNPCSFCYEARSFRWTADGGIQDLGVPLGSPDGVAIATAVSSDGAVVVGYCRPDNSSEPFAFRWTQALGMEYLTGLPGTTLSIANGVNANGSVVVGYVDCECPDYSVYGFRWTPSLGMQVLGTRLGLSANGVSGDGSVIVGDDLNPSRAFRWTEAGGVQNLGTFPGNFGAWATAVSGDGSIIIGYTGYPIPLAFRWTSAGGMQDMSSPGGPFPNNATAVSDDGSIVVGGTVSPFYWTQSLGTVGMSTYFTALGLDLTGWDLIFVTGISADGSAIVGDGYYNGEERGWVVNGLPPSSACNTDPVSISQQPVAVTTCLSDTATFSIAATGGGSINYHWQVEALPLGSGLWADFTVDGPYTGYPYPGDFCGDIEGSRTSTLGVAHVSYCCNFVGCSERPRFQRYRCVASNACGGVASNAALLTLNFPPTLTQQPANAAVCADGTAAFSVAAGGGAGGGPLFYRWQIESSPLGSDAWFDLSDGPVVREGVVVGSSSGTGTSGHVFQHNQPDLESLRFRCTVTNACGRVDSDPALLRINSADFNGDGDIGTDADIESFFACLAGHCCATCGGADFNGDGDTGTDADIEAFFRVLAGGSC